MKKSKQNRSSLSKRVLGINYSLIRKSFVFGPVGSLINMGVGQPDFDVPVKIKAIAKKSIDKGDNRYTETKGIFPLRQAISNRLHSQGIVHDADNIIVTSGTTAAMFMIMLSLIEPGDEVIIFEPYFVAYVEITKIFGGKPVVIRTKSDFQPDPDILCKAISPRTKLIIINSPNNPTGAVYSEEVIKKIVAIAKKDGIYILSDEIYRSFVYDITFFSPAQIYKKTIVVDGLSKSQGMTGWRIGYIAGPKKIIDAVEKVQQFSSVCAPSAFQTAAIESYKNGLDENIRLEYRERRDMLLRGLEPICPELVKPGGAFYFFLKCPPNAKNFAGQLKKKGVIVVPGRAFGKYENFVRISFAVSKEKIALALKIIRRELDGIN